MKNWEPWETNMRNSNNSRMFHHLTLHTQQIIKATSTQDLDPRPLANNDHPSVLSFEMYTIEPGEPPSRSHTWKPLRFRSHIKNRDNRDRFPLSLWEVWSCSTLGVPIPALIGPSQQCASNSFHHDSFGDHLQTWKVKSVVSQVYDWVVYRLGGIFGSVGHRVKIHKITSVTGKERDDLEIKDYVVLQKPQEQVDRLPPPRTFILDFTLTHTRYHSSHVHTTGQLTNTRRSDGEPEFDGTLREVSRKKILHYHQLYTNRPDPIVFLPVEVDTTTGRLYDDFSSLLFLQDHREVSGKGQWGWFWRKLQSWGFLYLLTCHPVLLSLCRVYLSETSSSTLSSFPFFYSLVFWLNDTWRERKDLPKDLWWEERETVIVRRGSFKPTQRTRRDRDIHHCQYICVGIVSTTVCPSLCGWWFVATHVGAGVVVYTVRVSVDFRGRSVLWSTYRMNHTVKLRYTESSMKLVMYVFSFWSCMFASDAKVVTKEISTTQSCRVSENSLLLLKFVILLRVVVVILGFWWV